MSNKWKFSREGVNTYSEVSAFLGGIFFTSLLILIQQREEFDFMLLEINLSEQIKVDVRLLHLVAIPLSISVILFIFSAIFFATACITVDDQELDKRAGDALDVFILGIFSMFISLAIILFVVSIITGLLGIAVMIGTFAWWIKRQT